MPTRYNLTISWRLTRLKKISGPCTRLFGSLASAVDPRRRRRHYVCYYHCRKRPHSEDGLPFRRENERERAKLFCFVCDLRDITFAISCSLSTRLPRYRPFPFPPFHNSHKEQVLSGRSWRRRRRWIESSQYIFRAIYDGVDPVRYITRHTGFDVEH